MVHLEYYTLDVNSQFDVRIHQDNGKWYCIGWGWLHFAKHVCINDFPNGYSTKGFKIEHIRENRRHYGIVHNQERL